MWVSHILHRGYGVVIPVLAQRLLLNMRKVDYMGTEPMASKLLFAVPPPESQGRAECDSDDFEMTESHSGGCHGRLKGEVTHKV